MTPDEFRANGHALIDWIADYVDHVEQRPVGALVEPGDVRSQLPEHPPTEPESFDAVMADVERIIVPGLTQWQHPGFFAYFPSNTSYPSILGELLSAGLGVQGMSWVTSPACTEVETLMLDWMRELLDLPERFDSRSDNGGGVIQGTASEATLVAILSARWRATAGAVNADGDTTRLVAYATSQAHSSIEKGLRIAGIGTDRIRIVPHDDHFAMRADALDEMISADRAAGLTPVLRVFDPWHDLVDGVRPDGCARSDLRARGHLAPRRRGHVGYRRARAGASLGQRGHGVRRFVLHEPPQVDGRQFRLQSVLDRRPFSAARCAEHPAGVPAFRRRRRPVPSSTTATGRFRSVAVSGPSSCGSRSVVRASIRSSR